MKIHNYDPFSKVFTCTSDADESPLEEGQFIIPANSTTIAPPPLKEGQVAVFKEVEWEVRAARPEPTEEQKKQRRNAEARYYLASTDWYVIRQMDEGTPVPEEVKVARSEARKSIVE